MTPITVATDTPGAAIAVGAGPYGVAFSPDGTNAYATNTAANTITPITVATNTPGTAIVVGAFPVTAAFVPDQAPVATLTASGTTAGSPTNFDATASTVQYGTIANYAWNFGDGTSVQNTAIPTGSHTYTLGGSFTVTLTETSSAGTSTAQVFTGQTVSRNGGASVVANSGNDAHRAVVDHPGDHQLLRHAQCPRSDHHDRGVVRHRQLGIAGWNVTATSTQFTSGSHTLPLNAVSVQSAPTITCDTSCTLATNQIGYPYAVPAGVTQPTATKMFNAAANTGIGNQTVTPTFTLGVPANSLAGTYTSLWTFTLSTGP